MIGRLLHTWELIRSCFWFIPVVITLLSIAASAAVIEYDSSRGNIGESSLSGVSVEGMRTLLSVAATSTVTLAGLVFSATLVALTLASSQYGPRLLYNFIRSNISQITFGVLLGNFAYCLIILRTLQENFLPHTALFLGFSYTIICLLTFIIFVHHLVRSLSAEYILDSVAAKLDSAIDELFPQDEGAGEQEAEQARLQWDDIDDESFLVAQQSGYLQRIDTVNLANLAQQMDARLRVIIRPGQLIVAGDPCIALNMDDEKLEDSTRKSLLQSLIIGSSPTPEQDFEFEIKQLVEVGIRSLSPGINDPFTAIGCIDRLLISMCKVASRKLPKQICYDSEDTPRVLLRPVSFKNLLETAFLQIRSDGSSRPDVIIRLLESMLSLARHVQNDDQMQAVKNLAELIAHDSKETLTSEHDQACVGELIEKIRDIKNP